MKAFLLALTFVFLTLSASAQAGDLTGRVVAVSDGDTLTLLTPDMSDATQADLVGAEDFEEAVRDQAIKREIIIGEISKIEAELDQMGKGVYAAHWLASLLPLNQSIRDARGWSAKSGDTVLNNAVSLMSLPLPEFKKELQGYVEWLRNPGGPFMGDNPVANRQALKTLLDFQYDDTGSHSFWTWLSVAFIFMSTIFISLKLHIHLYNFKALQFLMNRTAIQEDALSGLAPSNKVPESFTNKDGPDPEAKQKKRHPSVYFWGYMYLFLSAPHYIYLTFKLRFYVCTKQSWMGFFWCPEVGGHAGGFALGIRALLWPLLYF